MMYYLSFRGTSWSSYHIDETDEILEPLSDGINDTRTSQYNTTIIDYHRYIPVWQLQPGEPFQLTTY